SAPGADAVVRQEDARREGESVPVPLCPAPREHVRAAGEDVLPGQLVLEAGTEIGPAHAGMLAALGRSVVAVRQRPRVALLSSGDELVEPDGDVAGGGLVSPHPFPPPPPVPPGGAGPGPP